MRCLITISLFFISLNVCNGQFTAEDFLSSSVKDIEIQSVQDQLRFLQDEGFKTSALREVEFRMRESRLGEGLSDYRLRFGALNPLEIVANKRYQEAVDQQLNLDLTWKLNEVLKARYKWLIDHYTLSQKTLLELERIEFYKRVNQIILQQPNKFSSRDVIQADRKQLKSTLKNEVFSKDISQLEYLLKATYSFEGIPTWEGYNWVSIDQIYQSISQSSELLVENNIRLKSLTQESFVKESMLRLKKQESFSNIGYLQAEYRTDPDRSFTQNIGFQLSLTLPIINSDRPDLARRRLELIKDSYEIKQEKAEISTDIGLYKIELFNLIERYEILRNKKAEYQDRDIVSLPNGNSVDDLIELQEYKFELQELESEVVTRIFRTYIDLLSYEGKLSESPYVNYLSFSKTTFSIEF